MKNVLRPSRSTALKDAVGAHTIVDCNVGPGGEVYLLLAIDPLDYRSASDGGASFAKIVPDVPQRYRVLVLRKGELELDLVIHDERFNIHTVQPVGDDLLLVCARSQYRGKNDVDLNARVYARDGTFLREFLLGDGVETVQTTGRGEIWTSYFDEGVFGNYGWIDPVGAAGLVAWNQAGDKTYEYDPDGSVDAISDCYALNVASAEDVWCCYYMDFPLVHLRDKRIVSTWTVPVSGSHAFAVGRGHALFAGDYDDHDTFQLVRLGPDGTSEQAGTFHLIGDDGGAVSPDQAVGRGSVLYVLQGTVLYELDLEDVLATRKGS